MHEAFIDRLLTWVARYSHLGVQNDLACLTLAELWAVYRYLQRLANG